MKTKKRNTQNKTRVNWIKAFTMAEDELREELYEKCSEVYSVNEQMLSEVYEKITESYNVTTIKSIEELKEPGFSELIQSIITKYQDEITRTIGEAYQFYMNAPNVILTRCGEMSIIRKKDTVLLQKRMNITRRRITSQIEFFLKETIMDFCSNIEGYLDSLVESLEFLNQSEEDEFDNNIKEDNILDDDKVRISKIFCHKKMEKLALTNGYTYKWSNGSHNVYEHEKSNKIVVIPAHTLGIGLSIAIQKQIMKNAC